LRQYATTRFSAQIPGGSVSASATGCTGVADAAAGVALDAAGVIGGLAAAGALAGDAAAGVLAAASDTTGVGVLPFSAITTVTGDGAALAAGAAGDGERPDAAGVLVFAADGAVGVAPAAGPVAGLDPVPPVEYPVDGGTIEGVTVGVGDTGAEGCAETHTGACGCVMPVSPVDGTNDAPAPTGMGYGSSAGANTWSRNPEPDPPAFDEPAGWPVCGVPLLAGMPG
jgi:hypothetical protein